MIPEIRQCPERLTAMRREVIPPREIGHAIGPGAVELRGLLEAAGVEVLGAPYARYHSFTKEEADVEVGFVVAEPVELPGVVMSTLSAGREAVVTHEGGYKDIPQTFAKLEEWVAENAEPREAPREVYLSDPEVVPMADRSTEIVYPIV